MKSYLFILLFLCLHIYGFCQNIKFQPNVNHKARHLKQGLSKTGDHLILESSKQPISLVDIFNEDFLESIDVDKNRVEINLDSLPAGNFIVQARVGRKRIIMYLRKLSSPIIAYSKLVKNNYQNDASSPQLAPLPTGQHKKKNVEFYWAIQESNSSFGATKSKKLIYKSEVNDLIEKNKLEMQSTVAKDNTLVIYAIYNKDKFMRKQFRNPKYYKSVKKSKYFNVVPYYSSFNEVETLPES